MKISEQQLAQLGEARRKQSFRRLLTELRQSAPLTTSRLTDETLLDSIEQACNRATEYGVASSKGMTAFAKMAVFSEPSFDRDPAINQYLRSPDLDPDYKITLLAELTARKIREGTGR